MRTLACDASRTSVVDYEAHFAKIDERVATGYYAVKPASGIDVELTATPRVAVERFTLPATGTLVVDLAKTLAGGVVDAAQIDVDDAAGEVTGSLHHLGGMSAGFGGSTLYFVARGTWLGDQSWATGTALAPPSGAAPERHGP